MKREIFLVLFLANFFLTFNLNGQQKQEEYPVFRIKYTGEILLGRDSDRVFYESERARVYIDSNLDKKFGYLFQSGFVTGRYLFDLSDEEKCHQDDEDEFHGDIIDVHSIQMKTSSDHIHVFRILAGSCDIASDYSLVYELKLSANSQSKKDFKLISLKFLGTQHP
ncbi:MAG TPA: hypothetical protein VE978_23090 [Chitinophagales bacterium]|nr:hypothetical protein [Chitinophagales bacterium]